VLQSARWGACEYAGGEPGFLAIGGGHQTLKKLYEGTNWHGITRQALARYPGAIDGPKVKYGPGVSLTSVLVPLHAFVDDSDLPMASRCEAAEEWVAAQVKGDGA